MDHVNAMLMKKSMMPVMSRKYYYTTDVHADPVALMTMMMMMMMTMINEYDNR
jgi:hypothetical protein